MALWRSGLTHRPLKATFTGPNPVRVTTQTNTRYQNYWLASKKWKKRVFLCHLGFEFQYSVRDTIRFQ